MPEVTQNPQAVEEKIASLEVSNFPIGTTDIILFTNFGKEHVLAQTCRVYATKHTVMAKGLKNGICIMDSDPANNLPWERMHALPAEVIDIFTPEIYGTPFGWAELAEVQDYFNDLHTFN